MPEDQSQKIGKPIKPELLDSEQMAARMGRLEKKITFLLGLVSLQTVLISAWLLTYLLPKVFIYMQVLLVVGAIAAAVYFFRKQIPGWLGTAARSTFSFLDEAEKKV